MKIRNVLMLGVLLGALAACSTPHPDLKSPCAGNEGSPCGPRHPVNDWWLNPSDKG
jgi:hypothetical protein